MVIPSDGQVMAKHVVRRAVHPSARRRPRDRQVMWCSEKTALPPHAQQNCRNTARIHSRVVGQWRRRYTRCHSGLPGTSTGLAEL